MPEQDLLEKLRDIHLPAPVSWWPLAPGWYLLALILLLLLYVVIRQIKQTRRRNAPKREALALLDSYQDAYRKMGNCTRCCMKISELLRRVALVYFPREAVAGLKGDQWLNFLTKTSNNIDFIPLREQLEVLPYQAKASADLEPLFIAARRWIEQRRKPCLK